MKNSSKHLARILLAIFLCSLLAACGQKTPPLAEHQTKPLSEMSTDDMFDYFAAAGLFPEDEPVRSMVSQYSSVCLFYKDAGFYLYWWDLENMGEVIAADYETALEGYITLRPSGEKLTVQTNGSFAVWVNNAADADRILEVFQALR